jgi:hypothetical protein
LIAVNKEIKKADNNAAFPPSHLLHIPSLQNTAKVARVRYSRAKAFTACFGKINTEEDEGDDRDIDLFQWEAQVFDCSDNVCAFY